jgi:non-reducing end alpha-L-arabinofuranosidase
MKTRISLVILLALALTLPVATLMMAASRGGNGAPPRPEGPGDIYKAGGCPLVAAHSTTRAMYASYNGPLYQVMRQSDGKTLDIGVVQPSAGDAGGYADAAAQDAFCANTYCWITTIYDQSGKKNHLVQAPRGGFSGPAMGGFNNVPVADWAPVTVMGHKAYGVFIAPGMGLRWNDAHGTAVDDQAEGQYWVVSGHHYNGGCCYDYGNAETDSRDDGDGTMETTYFGNATSWYHGPQPGPWIMTDQENNLVGCVTDSPNNKNCDLPIIGWRFVMGTADGEPHHWRSMGGDAQKGDMKVQFDGPRVKNPNNTYDPMRKQGAILLGNGGDNSNGSQGTFYEGAMTAAGTMPTQELNQKVQANVVAAKYDVPRLSIAPASAVAAPPGLQTFAPGSSQDTVVTFTNTTGAPVTGLKLSIAAPTGWTAVVSGGTDTSKTFAEPVAPGAAVNATFKVTSGSAAFNGDMVANASWTANGQTQSDKMAEKVRNVNSIKINEFADTFIELYNAGGSEVDISNWTLTQHPTQQPVFSSVKIPTGTKLASKGFYVFGLSNSGLAVPASKGDPNIYVRSATGMNVGDTIEIGAGSTAETRKIASIKTPAPPAEPAGGRGGFGGFGGFGGRGGFGGPTTVWQPLPDGPVITIPVGSTSIPVTSTAGFEVGQKMAIGYGATYPAVANTVEKYEVVTITEVGKAGTQAWLSADVKPGDTNIKVSSVANITAGDKIRLGYDTLEHGVEWVTVKNVGTQSAFNPNNARSGNTGTGLDLAEPVKFHHSMNMPFSARGTGISFQPATKFAHSSNEPVLPLGTSIALDKALANDHEINAAVRDEKVTTEGYQGTPKPNQWFGGPAIGGAGNMVLRDATGLIADSLNFGGVIDPWASEGYQATSPGNGCSAPAPSAGGRGGMGGRGGPAGPVASRSTGRFPDGNDLDSNCRDFQVQGAGIAVAAESAVGANNVKVDSVAGLTAGQTVTVGTGESRESAVIATIGTPGATAVATASEAGATTIPVANPMGFSAGQTITIDSGANAETAVVASVSGGRGGRGGFGGPGGPGGRGGATMSITVTSPLKSAHAVGAQVSGSGITFTTALTKAHAVGAQVGGFAPTPGAPNQYSRNVPSGRRGN